MEAFINPQAEKQGHIINAALNVFGRSGYKKASLADIAEEAGVAKGMVNYYYGSKKNLYLYLAELCGRSMVDELEKNFDSEIKDFFDHLKMMMGIKIAVIKEYPAILLFLTGIYQEEDPEVKDEIQAYLAQNLKLRERFIFEDTDVSRFKDDVDPKLIDKLLVWAAEGFTNSIGKNLNIDEVEKFTSELYDCLDLMKKYFYK